MAKKAGKMIFWGLVIGGAAAGVYHYLQNKDKAAECYDDFDDFDNFEDVSDSSGEKDRNYVPLNFDSAKAFVNDTLDKAKEAVSKVSKKFQNAEEDNVKIIDEDTVPVEIIVEITDEEDSEDVTEDITAEENSSNNNSGDSSTTEDFFDDDEQ